MNNHHNIKFTWFNENPLGWTSDIEARVPWLEISGAEVIQYCCETYDPNVRLFFQAFRIMIHADILSRRLGTAEAGATILVRGKNRKCGLETILGSLSVAGRVRLCPAVFLG